MTQTSISQATRTDPAVRSAIYKLLSLVFRYPDPELFEAYRNGEFLSALFYRIALLPHLKELADEYAGVCDRTGRELATATFQDFEVAFTGIFDVGAPEPPCPPYEGIYRPGMERTAVMLEVSEFYKHFGLGMNTEEGRRELPDNLSAELEFLHFLTFKEGQARDEDEQELMKGYILAQKDFLERHLLRWVPVFYEKLQRSANGTFFLELCKITLCFLGSELKLLNTVLQRDNRPD